MIKILPLNIILLISVLKVKVFLSINVLCCWSSLTNYSGRVYFPLCQEFSTTGKWLSCFKRRQCLSLLSIMLECPSCPWFQAGHLSHWWWQLLKETTVCFRCVEAVKACSVISEIPQGCGCISALLCFLLHTFIKDASLKKRLRPSNNW